MGNNVFVSVGKTYPSRWRIAFPQAEIHSKMPEKLPPDSLVWLHNMLPGNSWPTGIRFVVMNDKPSDDKGLEALAQGASGYCNAYATPELLHSIESVIRNNGLWVGESLLSRLVSSISTRSHVTGQHAQHPALQALSEREREVALRVACGESNKEITRDLSIAERTIKAHLTAVFEKLGVRDRLQLAILLNTPG